MRTIPDSIYQALSARERVRAAVSAQARDDDEELERLKRTCPRKLMSCTDPAYSDTMDALMRLALVVESDLRGLALSYRLTLGNHGDWAESEEILREAASLVKAWERFLHQREIEPAVMAKAFSFRHPYVTALLSFAQGMESLETVGHWSHLFEQSFT